MPTECNKYDHPWAALYGMDEEMIQACEEAWKTHNASDGPVWENNARYKTEFAAGFSYGTKYEPRPTPASKPSEPYGGH